MNQLPKDAVGADTRTGDAEAVLFGPCILPEKALALGGWVHLSPPFLHLPVITLTGKV